MDIVKESKKIDVIMYTFSKNDPSYVRSKYNLEKIKVLGLNYNEKQICVTKSDSIIDRTVEDKLLSFDEVIV